MTVGAIAECRKCHRRLTRSTDIGPTCLRRELAASRAASPTAALPPKWRPVPVSRGAALIPGQTELDLELETP